MRAAHKVPFVTLVPGNADLVRDIQLDKYVGTIMIGRHFFVRHAAVLIKHAQSTANPRRAAMLIKEAAELKAVVEELSAGPDPRTKAPCVEARLRKLNS
jgi:hypothetical protein